MFQKGLWNDNNSNEPLASKLRPNTFDEFIGQEHILGKNGTLRKAIEEDRLFSCILYGPPGCGKTSVANLIEKYTKRPLYRFSAATSGLSDLRPILEKANTYFQTTGRGAIIFLDEIHRFNRLQQDILLPYVEEGKVVLIGSTTENPSFEVNPALLSRCEIIVFRKLKDEEILKILSNAVDFLKKSHDFEISSDVLEVISKVSEGDARSALNYLELVVRSSLSFGNKNIDLESLDRLLVRNVAKYRKKGDEHFDLISAFHKSMRGSDPDAALYYMARMLEAGEDPLYIARRIVRFASEDVGLADPKALLIAVAAYQATQFIGMPECTTALAEAVIYLSVCPKSNSVYEAYEKAADIARKTANEDVPFKLRNPVTELMKNMGYGKGYKYVHDFENGFVVDNYLPEKLKGMVFYYPNDRGTEKNIKKRLEDLWQGMKNYEKK
ncbi:MAG: putative ATPase [Thermotogaceae bacterium]|jgi:putative ATPase|nr:putative ATPase [Thermotogaceae bacterium]MDN5337515.1 putative ATPase [Thermotogaceae bacterium]